jgi:hypothetical protein
VAPTNYPKTLDAQATVTGKLGGFSTRSLLVVVTPILLLGSGIVAGAPIAVGYLRRLPAFAHGGAEIVGHFLSKLGEWITGRALRRRRVVETFGDE